MEFDLTERQAHFRGRVREFIQTHVRPAVPALAAELNSGNRWEHLEGLEPLKARAKPPAPESNPCGTSGGGVRRDASG